MKKLIMALFAFALLSTTSFSQQVASSADQVTPLLNNAMIPDVTVKNTEGEDVSLRDLVSDKPSIFVFYRGGWCPYCNQHLADLKKIENDIEKMGYQVFAISADRPELLKETMAKNELTYTLLSDSPMNATKAFGIAFKVDDATINRYKEYGIDLEEDSGYNHHLLPAPAIYLVGTDGIVDFNYVNPDYKKRIEGEILLAAAKAYAE